MKAIKEKQKKEEPGVRQVSLGLSEEDIAFLDTEAKSNGRTRAGQARFFLSRCRSTAVHCGATASARQG